VADLKAVSQAVIDRAMPVLEAQFLDWAVEWFKPEPLVKVPAVCLRADPSRFVDYHTTMGNYAKWHLRMGLYVPMTDQDAGRTAMAALTDPSGPLISRLEDEDRDITDDALWALCGGDVKATTGKGWEPGKDTRSRWLYADIGLDLGSN